MSLTPRRSEFRQIADILRTKIESGEYAPGSLLPSQPELAAEYQVSQPTINQAVRILRTEGLIRVARGIGAIVREIPVIQRDAMARYHQTARERAGSRGAFDGEIKSLGMIPRSDLTVSRIRAPDNIATALQLPANSYVVVRKRHMYANDYPVQLAPSYIPADIADNTPLSEKDSGPGGIISRFKDLGYEQVRITEAVKVRRATAEEQSFLRLEQESPVTEIFHIGYTAENKPVEVCIHSIPSHLWILNYEWDIH